MSKIPKALRNWDTTKPLGCVVAAVYLGDCQKDKLCAYYYYEESITLRFDPRSDKNSRLYFTCSAPASSSRSSAQEKQILFRLSDLAQPILYSTTAEGSTFLFMAIRTPPRLLRCNPRVPQSCWDAWQVYPPRLQ